MGKILEELEKILDESVWGSFWLPKVHSYADSLKKKGKKSASWKAVSSDLKAPDSMRGVMKSAFDNSGIDITESEENLDESAMGDMFTSIQELIQDLKKAKKDSITWKEASEAIIKSGIRIKNPDDPEFKKMVTRELNKKKITVK